MIYVFTICEYGGGEIASCRVVCTEDFADGFELSVRLHIDEDAYYVCREEIGEGDADGYTAILEPWVAAA